MSNQATTVQEFNRIKNQIVSSSKPSSGANLLGMVEDFSYYLNASGFLTDIRIKTTREPDCLLEVSCRVNKKIDEKLSKQIITIWNDDLRYKEKDSFYIAFDEEKIEFYFVTQMQSSDLFVTDIKEFLDFKELEVGQVSPADNNWPFQLQDKIKAEKGKDFLLLTEDEKAVGFSVFRMMDLMLGGSPAWLQYPQVPKNKDNKKMEFVGQLFAPRLSEHLHDFMIYLFYCPKESIVTQVIQFS